MRLLRHKWHQLIFHICITINLIGAALATDGSWTPKHEEGRCAIRGQCGKKSFFGGQLPCPDNEPAQQPERDTRAKLVAICGDRWSTGNVCCDVDQVRLQDGVGLVLLKIIRLMP